jgi:hypothetical protein
MHLFMHHGGHHHPTSHAEDVSESPRGHSREVEGDSR